MNYSRITSEAGMVMKMPLVMTPSPTGCREELRTPPKLGLMMTAATKPLSHVCTHGMDALAFWCRSDTPEPLYGETLAPLE